MKQKIRFLLMILLPAYMCGAETFLFFYTLGQKIKIVFRACREGSSLTGLSHTMQDIMKVASRIPRGGMVWEG
jgi:hypothetical protein